MRRVNSTDDAPQFPFCFPRVPTRSSLAFFLLEPDAGFSIRHEDTSMQRFAIRSAVLIAGSVAHGVGSGRPVGAVGVGAVFPRGLIARVPGDTLVANVTNANPLAFGMAKSSPPRRSMASGTSRWRSRQFGAGLGFQSAPCPACTAGSMKTAPDRAGVALHRASDGRRAHSPIRPSSQPATYRRRLQYLQLPLLRGGPVHGRNGLSIFSERYRFIGNAPGARDLGGVRMPIGGTSRPDDGYCTIASGNTGGAANGFLGDKIDLSGDS